MAPVNKPSVCFFIKLPLNKSDLPFYFLKRSSWPFKAYAEVLKQTEFAVDVCDVSAEEEEDVTSVLRDRSHIDETLRLAMEEKAGDYAGEDRR